MLTRLMLSTVAIGHARTAIHEPEHHVRRIAHAAGAHPYRANVLLQDGQPLQLSATPITRISRIVTVLPSGCSMMSFGVGAREIDLLVTNQPNPYFLRNWREALQLPQQAHPDTFDMYGNMFGAAIPITLEHAIEAGRLKSGALLALAGFAHAGDYAAATLIRWQRDTHCSMTY